MICRSVIGDPILEEDRVVHLLSSRSKFGHIRRNCNERVRTKLSTSQNSTNNKLKANRDGVRRRDSSSSDSDCIGLTVNHMMSASSSSRMKVLIVDSSATFLLSSVA